MIVNPKSEQSILGAAAGGVPAGDDVTGNGGVDDTSAPAPVDDVAAGGDAVTGDDAAGDEPAAGDDAGGPVVDDEAPDTPEGDVPAVAPLPGDEDEPIGAGGVAPSDEEPEKDPNDLTWLRNAIRGEPGTDYPILADIPKTAFKCSEEQFAGYYGDPEARCQVFHICQKPDDRMDSFLCPNGTIFSQKNFVCVWWWQYDCSQTEKDYALNANLYAGTGSGGEDSGYGVDGGGQSNSVDSSAGGTGSYPDSNGGSDGTNGDGKDTGYGVPGAGLPSPSLPSDNYLPPASGGADDTTGDAVGDNGIAPAADPLADPATGNGATDDTDTSGVVPAAGGAVSPAADGTLPPAGKTNTAVRRRLRGRGRSSRTRFALRPGRNRSARRRSSARSTRRGLRSRSRSRSRSANRNRNSIRRSGVRRGLRRRTSSRRSNASRRNRRRTRN